MLSYNFDLTDKITNMLFGMNGTYLYERKGVQSERCIVYVLYVGDDRSKKDMRYFFFVLFVRSLLIQFDSNLHITN